MIQAMRDAANFIDGMQGGIGVNVQSESQYFVERLNRIAQQANEENDIIPLQVKPGDRILYHPAVQSFDRKIPAELLGLPATEECYICNEMTSVLAVLERE